MADLSDASNALVTLVAASVYPLGVTAPSVVNAPVYIYGGWPNADQLAADLAAGKFHVSVYPTNDRPLDSSYVDWVTLTAPTQTLTLTLSGNTVTVGGTVSVPQNVALVVDGVAYAYAVQATDTLASIAAALGAQIALVEAASVAGAVITLPNATYISPRVGATGTAQREVRCQERTFQVGVWSATPDGRDALAKVLDAQLSDTVHLPLPDSTVGTVRYVSSRQNDGEQNERIYRRDLMFAVQYSTTVIQTFTQIVATQENISAGTDFAASQFPIKSIVE